MILSYVATSTSATTGAPSEQHLELALVPDKLDAFSVPILFSALRPTESAVLRVGPTETCTITREGPYMHIKPVRPAKLFITLDLPTSPGINVEELRVQTLEPVDGVQEYEVGYRQDRFEEDEYRIWRPTELGKRGSDGGES